MARSSDAKRRPRVRKSAPTVRERVEAANLAADNPKPKAPKRVIGKAMSPIRRLKQNQSRPLKLIGLPFRFVGRGLRWLVPKYFVNSWRELRQVHWPNRRETWRLTTAVFVFAIVFGALVAGVDKGLDEIFKKVILK